ncbi:hypothetical protein OAF37_01415 [Rubripirellula sp.]|nr:hypothetical protein [Rubripirellula sp.]
MIAERSVTSVLTSDSYPLAFDCDTGLTAMLVYLRCWLDCDAGLTAMLA